MVTTAAQLSFAETVSGDADDTSADREFATLAPALASRAGRLRLAVSAHPDTGYKDAPWPRARPAVGAAVYLFDDNGCSRAVGFDFDPPRKQADAGRVEEQCARLARLLDAYQLPYLVDRSDRGGRHVWVPLSDPRPQVEVYRLGLALRRALRLSTLDLAPLSNAATGCLRAPGSVSPRGGRQRLITPYADAVRAVSRRAHPEAWARLVEDLCPPAPAAEPAPVQAPPPRLRARRPLAEPYQQLASIGTGGRPGGYPSASEGRFAVLCHALRKGWTPDEIVDGVLTWPAIHAAYQRKYRRGWRARCRLEIARAAVAITAAPAPGSSAAQNGHTRGHLTRPQGVDGATGDDAQTYLWIRLWWAAAERVAAETRGVHSGVLLRVLLAVGAHAQMAGRTTVSVGCRSLAEHAGLNWATVAKALRELREQPDPPLHLIETHHGDGQPDGDLYELRIPDRHSTVEFERWRPGPIRPVPDLFRTLPVATWLVWRSLHLAPQTVSGLAAKIGLAPTTVRTALGELAAVDVAVRDSRRGWRLGPVDAEQLASPDGEQARADQHDLHVAHRAAYAPLLRRRGRLIPRWTPDIIGPPARGRHGSRPTPSRPQGRPAGDRQRGRPDDTAIQAVQILERLLGATTLTGPPAGLPPMPPRPPG